LKFTFNEELIKRSNSGSIMSARRTLCEQLSIYASGSKTSKFSGHLSIESESQTEKEQL
jgi:hypothetical protein